MGLLLPVSGLIFCVFSGVVGGCWGLFGSSLGGVLAPPVAAQFSPAGRQDIRTMGIGLEAPGGRIFERNLVFLRFLVSYAALG